MTRRMNTPFTLAPSPARRVTATFMLMITGTLLVWLAVSQPQTDTGWRVFLFVMGGGILWATTKLWTATSRGLVLTDDTLEDTDGTVLCRFEDIREVERGLFAFKPSNGFLIRLNRPLGRAWAPGLWWRFGTRLGVGGVTPAGQSKAMADILAMRLKGENDLFGA